MNVKKINCRCFIIFVQVETRYNTPPTKKEVCQFDMTVTTIERVKKQYDQPIVVGPKPTKAPKKPKRPKKCRKKSGRKCKSRRKSKCRGRRCKNRRRRPGVRRRKPKPTTAAPLTTRNPIQNDQPAPNSVSIKICTR